MIMLDAVTLAVMIAYHDFIESQAQLFGEACWAQVYQAESRFHREKLGLLRERKPGY